MKGQRGGNDVPKGWATWPGERRRLHDERVRDPMGRPEVRYAIALVRELDGRGVFDRPDWWPAREAVELEYRRCLLAFRRVKPPIPTNPKWFTAGAALFEAATLVALGYADREKLAESYPAPGRPGPARNQGVRWCRRAVGFLLKKPGYMQGSDDPYFERWHPREFEALREAWRADRELQEAYPWEASVRSMIQAVGRGPVPPPDPRCLYPGPMQLLEIIRDWPVEGAPDNR